MGIFSRKINNDFNLRAEAGSGVLPPTRTIVDTTPEAALTLAAVYRSVSIIASTVSQLPCSVTRSQETITSGIANRPDINISTSEFWSQTVISLALHGNAYWWVSMGSNGQAQNLTVLDPKSVSVSVEEVPNSPLWRPRYEVNGTRVDNKMLKHLRLFTPPAQIMGLGPIQAARQDLATAMNVRAYGDAVLSNGGVPTGVLSTDQFLNQEQADKYRASWNEAQNVRGLAVLGAGLTYSPITLSPQDIQYLENQQFSTAQIGRLFGIPASWLGIGIEGSSITYSTTEDLARAYIQTTLTQYLTAIESALSDVLPRGQQARFKLDGLLRADIKSRVEAYKGLFELGAITTEEIRASEGLDGGTPMTQDGAPV